MNREEEKIDEIRLRFLIKYWKMTIVLAAVVVVAAIVGIFVLLWQVDIAVVPATLGQWSVGIIITFCLNLIFWELVLVGSWIFILLAVLYFIWYNNLPEEDRKGWAGRGKRESSDAISFFVGLAWLLMLYIDGRWNLTFDSWTFTDWIYSWLTAGLWVLLIFGIPVTIGVVAWVGKEMKKAADEPAAEV